MEGGGERGRARRGVGAVIRVLPVLIGWVVIAFAVDVGLGLAIDAVRDPSDDRGTTATATAAGQPPAGQPPTGQPPTGSSTPAPALSRRCVGSSPIAPVHQPYVDEASPDERSWIEEYWCEFDRLGSDYVPFLYSRTPDTAQSLINIRDGVRRSYEPATVDDSSPVIWFFGGSTMFGWGQRDAHTIPSEVARLSEADGLPVRVVNFGQLAWVHWQEVLAFQQELAHRPGPDLVVFYDGVNDANVQGSHGIQSARPSDDPTLYDFGNDPPAPDVPVFGAVAEVDPPSSLAGRWLETSALARLVRGTSGLLGLAPAPAAADDAPTPDTVVARTRSVYERGRARALDLARRGGVDARFFWQPRLDNVPDAEYARVEPSERNPITRDIERRLVDGLTPPTVDLSGAMAGADPDDIFTDGAHTTERGAALVAAAIWSHLRPGIEAQYATGPEGGR